MYSSFVQVYKAYLTSLIKSTFDIPNGQLSVGQVAKLFGINEVSLRGAISVDSFPVAVRTKADGYHRYFDLYEVVDHLTSKAIPACLSQGDAK